MIVEDKTLDVLIDPCIQKEIALNQRSSELQAGLTKAGTMGYENKQFHEKTGALLKDNCYTCNSYFVTCNSYMSESDLT